MSEHLSGQIKGLPENAYAELKPGEEYKPVTTFLPSILNRDSSDCTNEQVDPFPFVPATHGKKYRF